MAATGAVNALTEDLIVLFAKTEKDTSRFRALKRRVDDTLKSPLYGRTDQFAVAKQFEGLQEKFQVLSKDDLADALRVRLTELQGCRGSWFPEILSLFLQLADRPAQLSRVDRIKLIKADEIVKPLSWSDIEPSGSAFCDDDIWEAVDFGAGSSDEDDFSSISSDLQQLPRSLPQTTIAPEDDYVIPDEIFSSGEDEELVASIESVQFWRNENLSGPSKCDKVSSRVITELQIVREAIFMLQGLPTSLFWRLDGGVEVDRRYTLSHLSYGALSSLLRTLSLCGAKIDILRRFARTTQTVSYLQTFHRSVEDCIYKFDIFLSDIQSQYLSSHTTVAISLLQLSEDVHCESRHLLLLADLVSNLMPNGDNSSIQFLNLLFNSVCMTQAAGDDDSFIVLAKIFFSCFETYARPIRHWMETGQLDNSAGTFLIHETRDNGDLRTLWHDWYRLEKQSELVAIPEFVRPFVDKIFITGKSMVFLRHLNTLANLEQPKQAALKLEDVLSSESSTNVCLSFDVLLESAFSKLVNENHAFTSSLLRKELDEQCGLWMSLQALEHIYLCKDMSIVTPIDAKIFELIDRGKGGWSDRFLLTELAQTAFSDMSFIDPSRLIVRSSKDAPSNNSHNGSRSVKLLNNLSFDYILPWPVANIIMKHGISNYQRISVFLMQIRRAKYVIVKQRLQYTHNSDIISDKRGTKLSYALRHNMLWFLNVLYSHLTDFVISSTCKALRKALSSSSDVDGMIDAHRSYMSSLEEQCLLSRNLHPLHQATITVLDLCVSFADMQATRYKESQLDFTKTPRKNAKPSDIRMTPKRTRYEYSYSDDDDDTDDEEDGLEDDGSDSYHQGPFHESQYLQRLKDIHDQFNRLIAFMAAGLKGVGRVDGQISWEMLAEKLEWRKEGQQSFLS